MQINVHDVSTLSTLDMNGPINNMINPRRLLPQQHVDMKSLHVYRKTLTGSLVNPFQHP
jgi:hypothetical protein